MKSGERDSLLFLEDIVKSMERVQEYITGVDFQKFKWDYKTVDAVIRNFEIIGEASKNVSLDVKKDNIQVPWEAMYRLRNRISHEYFGIDYEIIWDIATRQLPKNYEDVCRILEIERLKKIGQ